MKKTSIVFLSVFLGVCGIASAAVINVVNDTTETGAVVNGSVDGGEYIATVSGSGNGFGGPVGNASLSVDSDTNGIFLGFSGLGDFSGNSIRIYFDSVAGSGFDELSDGAGFNDFDDFGRERISRPASDGLTLPFDADYGMIISDAFTGFQALFELVPGGNGSLNFSGAGVVADPIGSNPTNSTIEIFIPYGDLGMSQGDTVDFLVIYANNNDQDSAFLSNEGFPFTGFGSNPGNGPIVLGDFHRLNTIPEPTVGALVALCSLGFLLRRKLQ